MTSLKALALGRSFTSWNALYSTVRDDVDSAAYALNYGNGFKRLPDVAP
jgi:hypothetical protein